MLNTKISVSPLTENKYLYGLDDNKQAISISIKSFVAGVSGKLQNGDIISIIAANYGEFRETIMPKELQYVRVLAVTQIKGRTKNIRIIKRMKKHKSFHNSNPSSK